MASAVAAAVLGTVGQVGSFAEMGQSHLYQKEQMLWTRRAYRLDKRSIFIELLNAAKEDIRDQYETYAGRIDTMLLVHTLLFTFALATLQFAGSFMLQNARECPTCVEVRYQIITYMWVLFIAALLIFPFWSMLASVWVKLQLDHWLEKSIGRINKEFRETLWSTSTNAENATEEHVEESADHTVQAYITHLGAFVQQYQRSFTQLWTEECDFLVACSTKLLYTSAVVAVLLTAHMFTVFLINRDATHLVWNFSVPLTAGLLIPALYFGKVVLRRRKMRRLDQSFEGADSPFRATSERFAFSSDIAVSDLRARLESHMQTSHSPRQQSSH